MIQPRLEPLNEALDGCAVEKAKVGSTPHDNLLTKRLLQDYM